MIEVPKMDRTSDLKTQPDVGKLSSLHKKLIGVDDVETVKNIFEVFTTIVSNLIDDKSISQETCEELIDVVKPFIIHMHLKRVTMQVQHEKTYFDHMAAILSCYIDLLLKFSKLKKLNKTKLKEKSQLVSSISAFLHTIFDTSKAHILDTLIQLQSKSVLQRRHLKLILTRLCDDQVFSSTPEKYMKMMIIFKNFIKNCPDYVLTKLKHQALKLKVPSGLIDWLKEKKQHRLVKLLTLNSKKKTAKVLLSDKFSNKLITKFLDKLCQYRVEKREEPIFKVDKLAVVEENEEISDSVLFFTDKGSPANVEHDEGDYNDLSTMLDNMDDDEVEIEPVKAPNDVNGMRSTSRVEIEPEMNDISDNLVDFEVKFDENGDDSEPEENESEQGDILVDTEPEVVEIDLASDSETEKSGYLDDSEPYFGEDLVDLDHEGDEDEEIGVTKIRDEASDDGEGLYLDSSSDEGNDLSVLEPEVNKVCEDLGENEPEKEDQREDFQSESDKVEEINKSVAKSDSKRTTEDVLEVEKKMDEKSDESESDSDSELEVEKSNQTMDESDSKRIPADSSESESEKSEKSEFSDSELEEVENSSQIMSKNEPKRSRAKPINENEISEMLKAPEIDTDQQETSSSNSTNKLPKTSITNKSTDQTSSRNAKKTPNNRSDGSIFIKPNESTFISTSTFYKPPSTSTPFNSSIKVNASNDSLASFTSLPSPHVVLSDIRHQLEDDSLHLRLSFSDTDDSKTEKTKRSLNRSSMNNVLSNSSTRKKRSNVSSIRVQESGNSSHESLFDNAGPSKMKKRRVGNNVSAIASPMIDVSNKQVEIKQIEDEIVRVVSTTPVNNLRRRSSRIEGIMTTVKKSRPDSEKKIVERRFKNRLSLDAVTPELKSYNLRKRSNI